MVSPLLYTDDPGYLGLWRFGGYAGSPDRHEGDPVDGSLRACERLCPYAVGAGARRCSPACPGYRQRRDYREVNCRVNKRVPEKKDSFDSRLLNNSELYT